MRSILIEVPAEECRHKKRDDGHGSAETGQLRLKPEIGLVVAIAVDGQIRSLHPHHRTDLRRHALIVSEPFAEHHRLTGKQDRRLVGINRLIHTADPISCGIDGVVDDAPADSLVPYSCRHPGPPESRIRLAARFVFGRQPFRRSEVHMAQYQFARDERQDYSDGDVERTCGRSRGEACSARPRNQQEQRAEGDHDQSSERFQHHVPMAGQEKRGYEMPVKESLIGDECACEERDTDGRERDLGNQTCRKIFEPLMAMFRRHAPQMLTSTFVPKAWDT